MFSKLKSLFRKKPKTDELSLAIDEINLLQSMNGGLERSIALLQENNSQNYNRFFRTICALVARAGGSVVLGKDLIETIESDTDLQLKYSDAPEGGRKIELEYLDEAEAEAEANAYAEANDAEFDEDQDHCCECGECHDEEGPEFDTVSP